MSDATNEATEMWHQVLVHGHRTGLSRQPGSHRCALCSLPFNGVGGVVTRMAGRSTSQRNPHLCNY
jgi:hypothetical protein